jgi:predicted metal-dependent HD superfamily phosphohydrolase
MSPARWRQLMSQWRAPQSEHVYSRLLAAYSEPHRHYHTGQHIDDCLAQLDAAPAISRAPEEVELALWFHDAIYSPMSSRNELRSAEWAQSFLRSFEASDDRCDRIFRFIVATKHEAEFAPGDGAVVVDIDLSILGRKPEEYDQYEKAIRQEYVWVPWLVYRRRRIEILESFLDRQEIYRTEHFRSRYEQQARDNLERAIEDLCK